MRGKKGNVEIILKQAKNKKKKKMFCNVTKLTNTCELSTSKMCIGTTWYRKCAIK